MLTLGIDPGLQVTGLALFDGRRVTDTLSLRGVSGAGDDYAAVTAAALSIADRVQDYAAEHRPSLIAVETFVDQGGQRNRFRYRWQTPLVIGAICAALRDRGDLIRWQDAGDVLSNGPKGYGTVKYLAEHGRLGHGLTAPVNEHEAAAIAHAMWADAHERQHALFGR